MNEARRFLRYVQPGLVYGVEVVISVWIVLPDVATNILSEAANQNALALAISGLLASGGIGYIFASAHHLLHWRLPLDHKIINHTKNIQNLIDKDLIPDQSIDRRKAFDITLELWYERLHSGSAIAGADPKITALGDIAHAAGAARVASVAALITTLFICGMKGSFTMGLVSVLRFLLMLVFSILCIYLFHDSYARTGNMAQNLYDRLLKNALEKEKSSNG